MLIASMNVKYIQSVTDVHHIHAWSLTNEINLMTLHIQIDEVLYEEDVLKQAKDYLEEHFNMQHVTIQVEHLACPDEACLD